MFVRFEFAPDKHVTFEFAPTKNQTLGLNIVFEILNAFLCISGSNDPEFGGRLAKWRDMDPQGAKYDKKFESRHVQTCPAAVQESRTCPRILCAACIASQHK